MAQDQVTLYNLALSLAGARALVSAPTESSREAEICHLWFEPLYRQILRAAPWPSTRAVARLALISEVTDGQWLAGAPAPGWQFAYAKPTGCLRPRFLNNYQRFDLGLLTANQEVIYTDVTDAVLHYTFDQSNVSMWDVQLYTAVAHALASYITRPLSGKGRSAMDMLQMANRLLLEARETAANEDYHPTEVSLPDWLAVRGSSYDTPYQRYMFPHGALLAVPNNG